MNQYKDYDFIAEKIFYPIYEDIADSILRRTGITNGEMLDIGCGGGHMGFAVMKLEEEIKGTFIDVREEAINLTLRRAKDLGLEKRCKASIGNVENLEFTDNTFDLVISRGSMPFWDDQIKAFKEIYRVLARGGKAYIGGGLGNPRLQSEVEKKMESIGQKPFHKSRKNSKALETEDYIELFSLIGCSYKVIENTGEGRWFLFSKE